jgi:hypothetical protein
MTALRPAVPAIACAMLLIALSGAAAAQERSPFAPALQGLPAPSGEPSGLVLGLRLGDAYRTLYLVHADGAVREAHDLPHLVSPQPDGFQLLGSLTVTAAPACPGEGCDWSMTELWTTRAAPDLAGLSSDLSATLLQYRDEMIAPFDAPREGWYEFTRRVAHVANGTVCIEIRLDAYTGGAHPFGEDRNDCLPLPPPGGWDEADRLTLTADLLPAARLDRIRSDLRDAVAAGRFEELTLAGDDLDYVGPFDTDTPFFRLHRERGQTTMTALAYGNAPYVMSRTYRVTAAVPAGPAPDGLMPYNPEIPFARLTGVDPDVRDAFVSPTDGIVFVLTNAFLIAVDPASGREVFRRPAPHDAAVMAEWAVGDAVGRWEEMIGAAQF